MSTLQPLEEPASNDDASLLVHNAPPHRVCEKTLRPSISGVLWGNVAVPRRRNEAPVSVTKRYIAQRVPLHHAATAFAVLQVNNGLTLRWCNVIRGAVLVLVSPSFQMELFHDCVGRKSTCCGTGYSVGSLGATHTLSATHAARQTNAVRNWLLSKFRSKGFEVTKLALSSHTHGDSLPLRPT